MDMASVQRNYESLSRAMQAKQAQLEQVWMDHM
jgi:flagellar basal body rod protein FlgG